MNIGGYSMMRNYTSPGTENVTNVSLFHSTNREVCRQYIIQADLKESMPEGIIWLLLAFASVLLNGKAMYTLWQKGQFRRIYKIYINNVFLSNISIGSVAYISLAIMRFGVNKCFYKDSCFFATIVLINVNQNSMILVICCQLKWFCGVNSLHSAFKRINMKFHAVVVVVNWVLVVGLVVYKVWYNSTTQVIFVFVALKVLLIIGLNFYVYRQIKRCSKLQSFNDVEQSSRNELHNTNKALRIILSFQCVIIATWVPLLTMILLQTCNVVNHQVLVNPFLISFRILFITPILDPLFYFWSKTNVSSSRDNILRRRYIRKTRISPSP